MKYKNGKDVLPDYLLQEIQKYTSGELLYIPKKEDEKAPWGHLSGIRREFNLRNMRIMESYHSGVSLDELMIEFCLSEASIRKIIYNAHKEMSSNRAFH